MIMIIKKQQIEVIYEIVITIIVYNTQYDSKQYIIFSVVVVVIAFVNQLLSFDKNR